VADQSHIRGAAASWWKGPGGDLVLGLACALAATVARLALQPVLGFALPYTTDFLAISLLALWRGWLAAAICGALAVPLSVLLFVEPRWSLSLPTYADRASIVGFIVVTTALVVVGDASRRGLIRAWTAAEAARSAEAALRESEERYRRLVELSPDAIFVTVNRRIVYANAAMVRLFGVGSAGELVGRVATELIHPDSRALVDQRVAHLGGTGQPNPPAEEHWVTPGGAVLLCEAVAAPTQWAGDRGIQVILRDIRERKEAEARLERQARELARSNADLEDFAYVVSHDLKEPLRGIATFASFLEEDAGERLTPEDRDTLATLVRLAGRMHELMDSLLEYSRAGRAELAVADTDLNQVVSEARESLGPWLAQQNAEVQVAGTLPRLRCDAMRLRQVFTNLITNAVKYNDSSPRTVEIGAAGARPPAAVGDGRAQPAIYVRDNGIGINERHHQTVFKMFRRLHPRERYGGGTGSGLAIVKAIIERHGGKVWVESRPGAGTTFWFTLSE
jgi:PAS domain S-box-containing protein